MSEMGYGLIIGCLVGLMIGGSLGVTLMAILVAGARSEERNYYYKEELTYGTQQEN